MAEIIWTNPALDDINDIAEYIALSNLLSAKKLVSKIFDKVYILHVMRQERDLRKFLLLN